MSAGMADVIAAHQPRYLMPGDGEDSMECECGAWRGDVVEDHAAHVAEELAKAGYGNVQEAKATALNLAADELARLPYVAPGAAGRGEYLRTLAVRRGDTDKWLRARANLATALNDPEGHALVQAIHDRKAGL